nr:immunoglobulin light chain junction region [Macaca mulatta]MOX23509.1 immunoglobulin light chain junction region [Macaca mulatta]MOX23544.1 immunoglobulin light chain junction region [Macaca mulatta]MOX23777.1 immunoglobulin light chain junction region [Macaca mulatta]MOX23787.1 immunoglobulin light chain junction region [Macaca mulatta]
CMQSLEFPPFSF